MGILSAIKRIFVSESSGAKNIFPSNSGRTASARYDAAMTSGENAAHWSMATSYDADTEGSPEVRRGLRNRARYEAGNNSWLAGMIRAQAYDLIGTGPRLQFLSAKEKANALIEKEFQAWAKEIKLAKKLRTARRARTRDGEAFFVVINNPRLKSPIKLDLKPIEADRVCNPLQEIDGIQNIDGVFYDDFGNITHYYIMKYHPGSSYAAFANSHIKVPAEFVIHLFDIDRPEQHRGISELVTALPDCAILRRYTRAMVKKMETSANISGVIESQAPADDSVDAEDESGNPIVPDELPPFKEFSLPRDNFMALPKGWKLQNHTLQNPTDSQSSFATQVKVDVGRGCMNEPKNVALGDSSGYNYASGRLDFQVYDKALRIEHQDLEDDCLDVIFDMWLKEFLLLPESPVLNLNKVRHVWFWDGREHVDPGKESSAMDTNLKNYTDTLAYTYGKRGRDWRQEVQQRVEEEAFVMSLRKKAGLQESAENPSGTTTKTIDDSAADPADESEPIDE